jgi:hypothetical protein
MKDRTIEFTRVRSHSAHKAFFLRQAFFGIFLLYDAGFLLEIELAISVSIRQCSGEVEDLGREEFFNREINGIEDIARIFIGGSHAFFFRYAEGECRY